MADKKPVKADIVVAGEIALPKFDPDKYTGKKVRIESAQLYEGANGYYVKVETELLDHYEIKDKVTGQNKPVDIRASAILGLQEDTDGNIGWGKQTKMGKALEFYKAKSYDELVGKLVMVVRRVDKNNKTWLSIEGMV